MSGVNITANLTETVNQALADNLVNEEDDWFLIRLVTAFIEAIWEQKNTSTSNYSFNRVGGITTYCCSVYGLSCLVMALVLNRTLVMASTNTNHIQQLAINRHRDIVGVPKSAEVLKKLSIISFRIGVIMLLIYNAFNVLVALNLLSHIGLSDDPLPWFYKLLSDKLFTYNVDYFASHKYMSSPKTQVMIGPTSDMYWPIFLNFCLSSFTETFISSIQGRKPYTESGITIFEHSLAFQEFSCSGAFFFGNSKFLKRPTEQVLLATLFSIFSHLNIHLGALLNDNKYRLIPSSIIGISFLSYFISTLFNWKILGFPTILIMTFTPQVLILFIIAISSIIFIAAIITNGFSLEDLNYASFFIHDVNDDEPDFIARNFNINLSDDFYTALLNVGMLAITSAGKSSYITELSLVTVDEETWIERSIWEKVKQNFNKHHQSGQNLTLNSFINESNEVKSGYAKLITSPSQRLIKGGYDNNNDHGGNDEFKSKSVFRKRYTYISRMVKDTIQLLWGIIINRILFGMIPDAFKKYILRKPLKPREYSIRESELEFERRKYRVPSFLRGLVKRREAIEKRNIISILDSFSEEKLQEEYAEILKGDLLPEIDSSSDYVLQEEYYSESEIEDSESEIESIGGGGGESSIMRNRITGYVTTNSDNNNNISAIQELITAEEFNEIMNNQSDNINVMQYHISNRNEGVLTRSQYKKALVSTSRHHHNEYQDTISHQHNDHNGQQDSLLSSDDSLKLLELILAKRAHINPETHYNHQDNDELSSKLDCVICQTNTREIITWPCKCFAICESCRLSLVSKGIEGCVCCRREVEGVSKVFIP
ncbi:hypothetical protein DFJ63DRAFT_313882 [Scheffersomyces coipomensis]|uniref:uncharacterized protein n=1 Tax=Scheffersomyces coipomensis TaxID=1788519 RepID=UPI00315D8FCD